MKRAVILMHLIVSFVTFAFSQETEDYFSVYENKIVWQKIFDTDLSFDQLLSFVKESGILENPELSENKILGKTSLINPDYKALGYGEMSVPMYIARNFVHGFVLIEYKDMRYRVTVKNIFLTQKYEDAISDDGQKTEIEIFAVDRKGGIKKQFKKKPSEILDYTFTKAFTFIETEQNDEW